jgi:hypothetical protein
VFVLPPAGELDQEVLGCLVGKMFKLRAGVWHCSSVIELSSLILGKRQSVNSAKPPDEFTVSGLCNAACQLDLVAVPVSVSHSFPVQPSGHCFHIRPVWISDTVPLLFIIKFVEGVVGEMLVSQICAMMAEDSRHNKTEALILRIISFSVVKLLVIFSLLISAELFYLI